MMKVHGCWHVAALYGDTVQYVWLFEREVQAVGYGVCSCVCRWAYK